MAEAIKKSRENTDRHQTYTGTTRGGGMHLNEWGIGKLRLDPFQMPHRVLVGDNAEQSYTLDRQGAVVKRRVGGGIPVTMSLPTRAFKGVAARACDNEDGSTSVSLFLLHHDEALSVPLLVTDNLDDIAADWHAWSRLLKLPMLIMDHEGQPSAVRQQLGDIMVENPIERRKRITTVRHRPRFLKRRKIGIIGEIEKITASEIIARR